MLCERAVLDQEVTRLEQTRLALKGKRAELQQRLVLTNQAIHETEGAIRLARRLHRRNPPEAVEAPEEQKEE